MAELGFEPRKYLFLSSQEPGEAGVVILQEKEKNIKWLAKNHSGC